MTLLDIFENSLNIRIEIRDNGDVRLMHFSALPYEKKENWGHDRYQTLVEVSLSGFDNPGERQGNKFEITAPGNRLKYVSHRDFRNDSGRKIEITQEDPETKVLVTSHLQFFDGIPIVRSWSEIENAGAEDQGLEYLSSFVLSDIMKEGVRPYGDKLLVRVPNNSWCREMQWVDYDAHLLGLTQTLPDWDTHSSKPAVFTNCGNWSTKEYLPMGIIENRECGSSLFFQIEHNGSWQWEIADHPGQLYLAVSGPNETYHHFFKNLKPGDKFVSVPVAVGAVLGGFDRSIQELTRYRRLIRRKNADNERLPIIFNDYMNCLFGDPTTEKEIPLIDAAAEMGCEYYVIDAGWYADGDWWNGVGEWLPSEKRFPEGLPKLIRYIRDKGMVPGLWLELEVMGVRCPKLPETDDSWFFMRHGKRVYDRGRFQLDFRSPDVIAHADEVIRRLVEDYGIGYIKMDYNIEPGIGTETDADSFGDGLLQHEQAYLAWLDKTFTKYPDLVIENCSSGSMRMDWAMLQRYSIQSSSDQTVYTSYASISANSPTALTPEQAAVWSYPLKQGDREEVVFNMVNALLLRIHQSGHLAEIDPARKALVREALDLYKTIRGDIREGLPFFPLGPSKFDDEWVVSGLRCGKRNYIAVWRRGAKKAEISLPAAHLKGKAASVRCIYPSYHEAPVSWCPETGELTAVLPEPVSARLFLLEEA